MEEQGNGSVRVIVFGPLIELLGSRTHKVALEHAMSIEDIVHALGAEVWLKQGLAVALNGEQCPLDIHPSNGDEVALLPPVSGG
ncbi:MAG TPA: MoaD/ThiS family protein [Candidatus Poseidoniaceae archaeon]|nr:MAG TPA: MoaD/ThiS family protein [Candidatus Poseidoniales archaeon]HII11434.1 MoaD/ThiS family protein [Candidatus Poseidoniaceae archaeon]|tara:strand:- start:1696 stop:1947 length:252 start_codon:yes stop_codon:yes gene_type:complete